MMKSGLLYSHSVLSARACCRLHARHAAITSAIYTLNICVLVVLLYSWRIGVNVKKHADLEDVYYGVQIAYFAIIGTQLFMVVLSVLLLFGIFKGSKPNEIATYMSQAYNMSMSEARRATQVALKRGLKEGRLSRSRNLYKLERLRGAGIKEMKGRGRRRSRRRRSRRSRGRGRRRSRRRRGRSRGRGRRGRRRRSGGRRSRRSRRRRRSKGRGRRSRGLGRSRRRGRSRRTVRRRSSRLRARRKS